MLQNAGRLCAVFEERIAVSFHRDCRTQRIFHHCNGRKSHKPVESKSWNMQDFITLKSDVLVMLTGLFVGVGVVGVKQMP